MDRMRAWVVALAAALLGCGDGPRVVDPLLLPYVEEFEAAAGFPVGSSVVFGEMGAFRFGACEPSKRRVTINNAVREWESSIEQMLMVFHELGHCELGRHHSTKADISSGCAGSIMATIPPNEECFLEHHDYYLSELFTGY